MKGLCKATLALLVIAACGRDGAITEPTAPATPTEIPSAPVAPALGVDSTTGASIETNQDDYSPGEIVHLVGRGWAPGETVNLHMTENPDTHADVDTNLVADATGGFNVHFYDVQQHDVGVTFTLTATGATSHSVAVAVFTDGDVKAKTNSASFSVTVSWRRFLNGTCSGAPNTTGSVPGVDNTNTTIGNVSAGQSLEMTVPSSASGSPFVNWTSGATTVTSTTICVAGATSNQNYTANYQTNTAPTLNPVGNKSVNEGSTLTFTATASDPNAGQTLTYSLVGAPAGATIGSASGIFSWTPTDGPAQNTSFTVQVTDNGSPTLSDTEVISVTVNNVAPTATFGAPSPVNEGSNISLALTAPVDPSTNDVTAGFTYEFDCGLGAGFEANGPTSTRSCPTTDNGSRTVKGKIIDKDGGSTPYTATVTINNVAPTATFNAPTSVPGGSNIALSLTGPADVSSADVTAGFTYAFDCGSGYAAYSGTNTASCPTSGTGSVTVKGKIRDKDGDETEYTKSVAINNVVPTANAGGPYQGNEGSPINISGTGSDPDGGTVSYAWTVSPNDGKCTFGSASAASTTVTCTDNGNWILTLRVTDDEAAFTTHDASLTVNNVAPTIGAYTLGGNVNEGTLIPFGVSNVTDPSSVDQAAGFEYSFSCDGGPFGAWSNSNTVNCSAGDGPGSVVIKGKARDKDHGVSAEVSSTFTVLNVKPTINAVSTNSPVNEGSDATLTVTTVTDPFPGDLVGATYAFACDGTTYGSFGPSSSVNCPTTDGPATLTIGAKVKDKDGAVSDAFTQNLTVQNVAPTVTGITAPGAVDEGLGTFAFSASGVTDPSTADVAAGFNYAFSCNGGTTWSAYAASNSSSCAAPDGPATITVAIKAKDKDGGESSPVTKSVTVNNLKPTVTGVTAPSSVPEGPSFNFSASGVTDPSAVDQAAGFQYAFSCDNGGTWSAYGANTGTCAAPDGPATITVAVKAKDKDGADSDPVSASVTVNNVVPTVTGVTAPTSVLEGPSPFNFSATNVTDPSAPDVAAGFQYAFSCDNGATWSTYSTTNSGSCAALNGPATINVAVKAKDKDGGESLKASASVSVTNVDPIIGTITFPLVPVAVGPNNVTVTWNFVDPGAETWTCTIEWDTGSLFTPAAYVAPKSCNASASLPAGVYSATIKVADDAGSDVEVLSTYIVVYDPNGGFVTGGGWFMSPPGAYASDPSLTGKANFGFVSKYQQGKTVPQGNTEFQFHAGNLNFKSTVYEWLVVAGTRAQFKGDGTINGVGGYGFLLTAIDDTQDKFRIKIVHKVSGNVVYDNQSGAIDDSPAATVLGGGSIVIHNKK